MFVGEKIGQIDGSRYQQLNCIAAGAAALAEIATVGAMRFTGADVRKASGETRYQGLNLTQAADAIVRLSHGRVILEPQYLEPDGTQRGRLRARIMSGRACLVVYDASVTYGTPDATNYFRGAHASVFRDYRWALQEKPHGEFYGDDPGTTQAGWRWWDANRLFKAAEQQSNGGIWILSAPDTEGVNRQAIAHGKLRSKPDTQSSSAGIVRLGRSYPVIRTLRGGTWKRANGTDANGWHEYRKPKTGQLVYLRGETLA